MRLCLLGPTTLAFAVGCADMNLDEDPVEVSSTSQASIVPLGIAGDPALTTAGNIIYYRGTNGHLVRLQWTSSGGWSSWDMGYAIAGNPVLAPELGGSMIYFRGPTNRLERLYWTASQGWSHWVSNYGITGDPAVVDNSLLYCRGSNGNLFRLQWTQSGG